MLKRCSGLAALALLAAAPTQATITFVSAELTARAYNIIGDSSYNIDRVDTDSSALAAPGNAIASASSNSNTLLNSGNENRPYLESASSVVNFITFTGANTLTAQFNASQSQSLAPSSLLSFATTSSGGQLSYSFTVGEAAIIRFSHTLTSDDSASNDITLRQFLPDSSSQDVFSRSSFGPALVASTFTLDPGTYTLFASSTLISALNSTTGATGSGSMASTYEITFAPFIPTTVPEPASWLTLILGFGLTGIALRQRAPRPRRTPTA